MGLWLKGFVFLVANLSSEKRNKFVPNFVLWYLELIFSYVGLIDSSLLLLSLWSIWEFSVGFERLRTFKNKIDIVW